MDETVQYVLKNKLKTVLYTWAGGISACMVRSACAGMACSTRQAELAFGLQGCLAMKQEPRRSLLPQCKQPVHEGAGWGPKAPPSALLWAAMLPLCCLCVGPTRLAC